MPAPTMAICFEVGDAVMALGLIVWFWAAAQADTGSLSNGDGSLANLFN